MIPFRRWPSGDVALDRVQDSIETTFTPIINSAIVDGRKVGPLNFVSGSATKVSHGLGRKIQGFICVDKTAEADFFRTNSTTSPELYVTLTSTNHVTASLWVF